MAIDTKNKKLVNAGALQTVAQGVLDKAKAYADEKANAAASDASQVADDLATAKSSLEAKDAELAQPIADAQAAA